MTQLQTPAQSAYKKPKDELQSYYKSWDVFAINQYIYSFMTENRIPIAVPFMISYKNMLVEYLTAEPTQRQTIQQLEEKIKSIFKSVPKREYNSL